MVGQEQKDKSFEEVLDPLETGLPEGEEWEWEDEVKQQKIRKRKAPVWEEGASSRKGRGGISGKKK